jgi:hypothetical protein
MLKEEEYTDMVRMLKENQNLYKDMKRYSKVKIKNDKYSWKKVYK